MKRAKIILTAIAAFAVIGGAFAFKATRVTKPWYSLAANGNCTVPFQTTLTTVTADATTTTTSYLISTINTFSHVGVCTTNLTIAYPAF